MRNTKKQGKFTLFVYPEEPNHWIGICDEFDLLQEGKTLFEAMERIKGASIGYLRTVIKFNMDDDLLNKRAPKEHWKKFRNFLKVEEKRRYWERQLRQILSYPEILKEERLNV